MILARQGKFRVAFNLPLMALFLAVLFFSSFGYCDCVAWSQRSTGLGGRGCSALLSNLPTNVTCRGTASTKCGEAECSLNSCWLGYSSCSVGSRYEGCQYIADCVQCSNACETEQYECEGRGEGWVWKGCEEGCQEQCADSTWYHCESVFTENNVIRSEVTAYNCDSVVSQRYFIGPCSDNDFCEGDGSDALDSCSYDTTDVKCKSAGQSGSLCTYVCSNGNFLSCTIAWSPGQPSEYQSCPSSPPESCTGPKPASSSNSVPNPDGPDATSSSSPSPGSSSSYEDCPACNILDELSDSLSHANQQRKYTNYVLDDIKENIEDYGTEFHAINSNTYMTAKRINVTNALLENIDESVKSLDLDNITATVDSVVVHVQGTSTDIPYYFDLDSLPVWRDTLSEQTKIIKKINEQIDTLVQDSSGENALKRYLPTINRIYQELKNLSGDCVGPSCFIMNMADSLITRLQPYLEADSLTPEEIQDIDILSDTTLFDTLFSIDSIDYGEDSLPTPAIPNVDSFDFKDFLDEQDSIMESIKEKLNDTTRDTLPLDKMAGDSLAIRETLSNIFMPTQTVESCFEFRVNSSLGNWAYNLAIDFADIFGWDICELIRILVRIMTWIAIIFTTIKGYIRAFGGGSGDG